MEDKAQNRDLVLWLMIAGGYIVIFYCRSRRRRMYFNHQQRAAARGRRRRRRGNNNGRNDNNTWRRNNDNDNDDANDTIVVDGVSIPHEYQDRFHATPAQRKKFILERIVVKMVESKIVENDYKENNVNEEIVLRQKDEEVGTKNKDNHNEESNDAYVDNVENLDEENLATIHLEGAIPEEEKMNEDDHQVAGNRNTNNNNNNDNNNNDDEDQNDTNSKGGNTTSTGNTISLISISQSIFENIMTTFNPNKDWKNESTTNNEIMDDTNEFINVCPICLGEFEAGQEICSSKNLDCHHSFHLDCMLEWLMKHDECPLCRQDYLKECEILEGAQSFEESIDLDQIRGGAMNPRFQRNASFRYEFNGGDRRSY